MSEERLFEVVSENERRAVARFFHKIAHERRSSLMSAARSGPDAGVKQHG